MARNVLMVASTSDLSRWDFYGESNSNDGLNFCFDEGRDSSQIPATASKTVPCTQHTCLAGCGQGTHRRVRAGFGGNVIHYVSTFSAQANSHSQCFTRSSRLFGPVALDRVLMPGGHFVDRPLCVPFRVSE